MTNQISLIQEKLPIKSLEISSEGWYETALKIGHFLLPVLFSVLLGTAAAMLWGVPIGLLSAGASIAISLGIALYPSNEPNGLIFRGSQNGCEGMVQAERVNAIVEQLEGQKERGIHFDRAKIRREIQGGACTALCLELIDKVHTLKKQYGSLFHQKFQSLANQFSACNQEMRNRQAVFNAMVVVKEGPFVDYARNKMQSLANFHNLQVGPSTKTIATPSIGELMDSIEKEVEGLEDGIYFTRITQPGYVQRTWLGHSIVYIQEKNFRYFYDPNQGLYKMDPETYSIQFRNLCSRYFYYSNSNEPNQVRFYPLSGASDHCRMARRK